MDNIDKDSINSNNSITNKNRILYKDPNTFIAKNINTISSLKFQNRILSKSTKNIFNRDNKNYNKIIKNNNIIKLDNKLLRKKYIYNNQFYNNLNIFNDTKNNIYYDISITKKYQKNKNNFCSLKFNKSLSTNKLINK